MAHDDYNQYEREQPVQQATSPRHSHFAGPRQPARLLTLPSHQLTGSNSYIHMYPMTTLSAWVHLAGRHHLRACQKINNLQTLGHDGREGGVPHPYPPPHQSHPWRQWPVLCQVLWKRRRSNAEKIHHSSKLSKHGLNRSWATSLHKQCLQVWPVAGPHAVKTCQLAQLSMSNSNSLSWTLTQVFLLRSPTVRPTAH